MTVKCRLQEEASLPVVKRLGEQGGQTSWRQGFWEVGRAIGAQGLIPRGLHLNLALLSPGGVALGSLNISLSLSFHIQVCVGGAGGGWTGTGQELVLKPSSKMGLCFRSSRASAVLLTSWVTEGLHFKSLSQPCCKL